LGHIAAHMILVGAPQLKLSIFGLKLKETFMCNRNKFIILLFGPLVNFVIILICNILLSRHFYLQLYVFMCVNLVIMLFNLLPIHFLDGGQLLSIIINNYSIEKFLDKLSVMFIFIIIVVFSNDIYYSICSMSIFLIYFIANAFNDV
ncbi:MAG: site-2 protease family protein, partial [Oscillospiraceae bacterium]